MAATRLSLYGVATRFIGERPPASLTENSEARAALDEVWTAGSGAVRYLLECGLWNFAMRAVEIDAATDVTPSFGWQEAFAIPTDYVRLSQISADETFTTPLNDYEIEGSYIYADVDPLYMRYVSDDEAFGSDLGKWPESFALYAGYWLGFQIAPRIKSDLDLERLEKRLNRAMRDAKAKDAVNERTRFAPLGAWASARLGGGGRRDRGKRNTLIG